MKVVIKEKVSYSLQIKKIDLQHCCVLTRHYRSYFLMAKKGKKLITQATGFLCAIRTQLMTTVL